MKKDGEEILRQAYRCPGTFRAHLQPKKTTSTQLFALEIGLGYRNAAVHVTTAVRLVSGKPKTHKAHQTVRDPFLQEITLEWVI